MIITIAAQKGGVSKTTTAAALAQYLSAKNRKVLLIDLDSQGSASLVMGAKRGANIAGAYELITGKCEPSETIQDLTSEKQGCIISGSLELDRLDIELNNAPGRDTRLKYLIEPLKAHFDYIVIDTARGTGTSLIQALTASDAVIIPTLSDPQALQGMHQITDTIRAVQKYVNADLKILCAVITQYDARATLTRQYEELLEERCKELNIKLAKTRIRKGIALQEAQALRENLFIKYGNSKPAADYTALFKELKIK